MNKRLTAAVCLAALMAAPIYGTPQDSGNTANWERIPNPVPADPALEKRIDGLLAAMTLEQKVGQMTQAEIRNATPADVRKYALGSVLNGGGSFPQTNKKAKSGDWLALADAYHDAAVAVGGTRIPVLWGTDAVHGHNNVSGATLFPHNLGLGAANDPALVEAIGVATAEEVAATGIGWVFAPTVAVASDFRWGRTYESYSENPDIVKSLGTALVNGLQGRAGSADFLRNGRVVATTKHFIGDGTTAGGVDQGDARISEAELAAVHGRSSMPICWLRSNAFRSQ